MRSRLLRARLRHRVILTLVSGETWDGVLFDFDARAWVMRDVVAVGVGVNRTNVTVDGELLVLVEDIAYSQLP